MRTPRRSRTAAWLTLLAIPRPFLAGPGRVPLDPVPAFVAFTPVAVEVDPRDQTLWLADQFLPRIAHLTPDGSPLSVVPVALYDGERPAGLAFEGSGADHLYVSDPDLQRLVRIDRQGSPAGSIPTGPLGISRPADLAWDDGSSLLLIADSIGRQVVRIRPRDSDADGFPDGADLIGSFSTIPLGIGYPMGLAVDPASRNLFVSDPSIDRVFEVTPEGTLVASFDSGIVGGTSVTGLAWETASGRIRLADAGRKVLTMSRAGTLFESLGTAPLGSLSPQGLTWDAGTGTLVEVSGERKLIRFQPLDSDQDGSLDGILEWREESTSVFTSIAPTGIALDPLTGDRFVSDLLQRRIFRVDPFAAVVSSFDTVAYGNTAPTGLARHPAGGSLFVSDNVARKIFEVTPTGTLLSSFITAPFKRKPPAEPLCNDPRGVAYDPSRDHLFIADYTAARVFEVTRSGAFVAAFPTAPLAPYPTDLAVDPAGDRIIVADSTGHLAEFSRSGVPARGYAAVPLGIRIPGAEGVWVDPDRLQRVVTDPGQAAVFFLSPNGAVLRQISLEPYGIRGASGAAWSGTQQRLYVVDRLAQRLHAISPGPDAFFGTGDDQTSYTSTISAGSNEPVGVVLAREQGKVGWGDEQALQLSWVTEGFDYLGHVDLGGAGVTSLGGIDRDPTSQYLFAADPSLASVFVTTASGALVQSLSFAPFGVVDPAGIALSPAEGLLWVVDRSDRTLVAMDVRPLLLREIEGLAFTDEDKATWSTDPVFAAYQVYRGDLGLLASGGYGGCLWSGATPPMDVVDRPGVGAGWFYLVVGKNSTGIGSLGWGSDGSERSLAALSPLCP